MECPLSGREGAQAIQGEIDALTDADAGMADEQERIVAGSLRRRSSSG